MNENEGEVIFEVSISQGRTSQIAVTVFLFVQQASFEAGMLFVVLLFSPMYARRCSYSGTLLTATSGDR